MVYPFAPGKFWYQKSRDATDERKLLHMDRHTIVVVFAGHGSGTKDDPCCLSRKQASAIPSSSAQCHRGLPTSSSGIFLSSTKSQQSSFLE
mmetsp:Transcript_53066/g.79285  ORF Transcript_53066/g.79285 Transcript_53066/m.79285 type:complete len:91 (+) Transcript_53066:539-811(+)